MKYFCLRFRVLLSLYLWGNCLQYESQIFRKRIPMVMSFSRGNILGMWSSPTGTPRSYNCPFNLQRLSYDSSWFLRGVGMQTGHSQRSLCTSLERTWMLHFCFQRCAKKGWCWGLRCFVNERVSHLVGILHGVKYQPVTTQGVLSIGFP